MRKTQSNHVAKQTWNKQPFTPNHEENLSLEQNMISAKTSEAEVTSPSEIKKFATKGLSIPLLKSRLQNFQLDSQPQNKESVNMLLSCTQLKN